MYRLDTDQILHITVARPFLMMHYYDSKLGQKLLCFMFHISFDLESLFCIIICLIKLNPIPHLEFKAGPYHYPVSSSSWSKVVQFSSSAC